MPAVTNSCVVDIDRAVVPRTPLRVVTEPFEELEPPFEAPVAVDPDAAARFRALFDAEHAVVLRYCVRRVSAPEDAADALAETFLVAWRQLDAVPRGREARYWLLGVARRVVANARRGELRRDRLADRLRDHLRTAPRTGTEAHVDEVQAALAQLGDDDRELLTLVTWEGLTPTEAGRVLGISAGAVRVRLHRARARLRRVLQSTEGTA